ncbi:MAG: 2-C-methyl-D-erythritol 4-phosphate cytidylyltransferase [Lachnospiraceae bacterium]|nr:2-C-methyl-D-erythritol 4-phosphate cytidylyltransferase [Lachnospiraceae bacterium]
MNYAILLSGGVGSRSGNDIPKQYVRAGKYMMITYCLITLLKNRYIDKIYIVCDEKWYGSVLEEIKGGGNDISKISGNVAPGKTRQLSVLNGLEKIMDDIKETPLFKTEVKSDIVNNNNLLKEETVLIQDAARPYTTDELIKRCYEMLKDHDGVMPALPMKDTVYMSENGNDITGLLERAYVYAGQAPELFRLKNYYEANKNLLPDKILKINGASEPAVIYGSDIIMINGDDDNVKVTNEADLRKFIQKFET